MSRVEIYDKESGAILFKRDKDGRELDKAVKRIEELEKKIAKLEKSVKALSKESSK